MARFSEEHPIEFVRGMRKPSPSTVRRALARRTAWLASRLERLTKLHGWDHVRQSPQVSELVALARIVEWLEAGELAQKREEPDAEREDA